jgi:hypothetical protein
MMTALTRRQTLYAAQEHPPAWKLAALEHLADETKTSED